MDLRHFDGGDAQRPSPPHTHCDGKAEMDLRHFDGGDAQRPDVRLAVVVRNLLQCVCGGGMGGLRALGRERRCMGEASDARLAIVARQAVR